MTMAHTSASPPGTPAAGSKDLAQAIDHLRHERLEEAEALLLRVLVRDPRHVDALHYQGVLRHAQGRVDEAVASIRASLAILPANAGAWNNLGNVLLLAQRADDAADAYRRAVEQSDRGTDEAAHSLSNLGLLYRKIGLLAESEQACREALVHNPKCAEAWYQLSITLMGQGCVHDGLMAHSKAVAIWPQEQQSRTDVVRALLLLNERKRAAGLLAEWLESDPGNPVAEHMLAACSEHAAVPERASDGYVQQVFDGFAASFDSKLEALEYRAPKLVAQALASAVGAPTGALHVADAGCGTGLCAPFLRPFARRLVGCDLSVGMLRRAKARGIYDQLHQAELTYYLATQPDAFDAVVSADTLCYFGALADALSAARRSLHLGGTLVFTVEALLTPTEQGYRILANGRYAHEKGYLVAALVETGFEVLGAEAVNLRLEAGRPVNGWLISARASESLQPP